MPSYTPKQAHTMNAACHNRAFALKVQIPQKVACDFHNADKAKAKATGHRPLWAQWHSQKTK